MPTPRINRVFAFGEDPDLLPATGPTAGGAVVVITGANFLTRARGGPPRPVRVRFGGVESPLVRVLRGNMLHATTPAVPLDLDAGAEGLVDVEVANLQEDETVIPGEVATSVDAYRYRLPRLDSGVDQAITEVERALIVFLATRICANSLSTQSVEYDEDDVAVVPEIATLPAIVISGPDVLDPSFSRESAIVTPGIIEDPERRAAVLQHAVQVDLAYRLTGQTRGRVAMLNLMSAVLDVIERARELVIPTRSATVRMDLAFPADGRPRADVRIGDSDIHGFTARIRVSNILVLGIQPHPASGVDVAVPLVDRIQIRTDPA